MWKTPAVVRRSFYHRNTAVGIGAVWMAVAELKAATAAYERVGLIAQGAASFPELDADVRTLAAGRGQVLLFAPRQAAGPVAAPGVALAFVWSAR